MRPGLCRSIALAGLLADWPDSPSIICRSNYYSVPLVTLAIGLVGCCCLCLLLCLLVGVVVCACCRIWLGGAGVSAVGTTLPQSPGWNEGKARNATLGKQYKSGLSSVGAALSALVFGLWLCGLWLCICWESAALTGLNKCVSMTNPGLAPWAMQEYRPFKAPCGNEYDVLTEMSTTYLL